MRSTTKSRELMNEEMGTLLYPRAACDRRYQRCHASLTAVAWVAFPALTMSVADAHRIGRPFLVFPPHLDQLRRIQQIIQGICPVPELMLLPHPCRYREEEELVDVRALGRDPVASAGGESGPPPPKKPSSAQVISSRTSFMQETVSCFNSG